MPTTGAADAAVAVAVRLVGALHCGVVVGRRLDRRRGVLVTGGLRCRRATWFEHRVAEVPGHGLPGAVVAALLDPTLERRD